MDKILPTSASAGKRVVHFVEAYTPIQVGASALIKPLDHTSALVSNQKPMRTSLILRVEPDQREFETLNSVYRKVSLQ